MPYVVLCGSAHQAPTRIVGPFDDQTAATEWAATQPGPPDRYAVVEPIVAPSEV